MVSVIMSENLLSVSLEKDVFQFVSQYQIRLSKPYRLLRRFHLERNHYLYGFRPQMHGEQDSFYLIKLSMSLSLIALVFSMYPMHIARKAFHYHYLDGYPDSILRPVGILCFMNYGLIQI